MKTLGFLVSPSLGLFAIVPDGLILFLPLTPGEHSLLIPWTMPRGMHVQRFDAQQVFKSNVNVWSRPRNAAALDHWLAENGFLRRSGFPYRSDRPDYYLRVLADIW